MQFLTPLLYTHRIFNSEPTALEQTLDIVLPYLHSCHPNGLRVLQTLSGWRDNRK